MKKVLSIAVVVLLIALSALPVFAAEDVQSPKASTANYIITIITVDGGTASYEYKTAVDENGYQTIVLTAAPFDKYGFTGWNIDGSYTPNGKMTDGVLELVISSDLTVTPGFSTTDTQETTTDGKKTEPTTKVVDNSSKSPQTGSNDYAVYMILIGAVIALGSVAVTVAKSRSNNK